MKNKKTFLGKPIIEYVIDTVKEAGVFDRIEVLTDDMDIMRIAEKNGISTLRENADIYSERRTLSDVVMDYICEMDISEGHVSVILPTSVFISPSEIIDGISKFKDDSFFVGKQIDKKCVNCYVDGDRLSNKYINTVSQKIPQPYVDSGQFYYLNVEDFIENQIILSIGIKMLELDHDSIDIDTKEDFERAKELYSSLN